MPHCTHCGRLADHRETVCPACAKPLGTGLERHAERAAHGFSGGDDHQAGDVAQGLMSVSAAGDALVAIARFKSIAEAGYFAHELMYTERIPVTVRTEDDFDALGGSWMTRFVLAAPESLAESAAVALQQLIEQTEPTEPEESFAAEPAGEYSTATDYAGAFTEFDEERESAATTLEESGVNWVPIVLTLAAGSVAFWGAGKLNEHPNVQRNQVPAAGWRQEDVWNHLGSGSQPWIQRFDNGRGRRELRFDPESGLATLREDADGDGVFEKELVFRRAQFTP